MQLVCYVAMAVFVGLAVYSCKTVEPDVIYKYITERDTVTNTLRVTDSIPYEVEKVKTIRLTRQERKALKDSMRHVQRMYKLRLNSLEDSLNHVERMYELKIDSLESELKHATKQNRQNQRTARNEDDNETKQVKAQNKRSWWLLFVGMGVGVILAGIIRKIRDYLYGYLFKGY